MANPHPESDIKDAFESAFQEWQRDIQNPEIQLLSSLDARTMLASYRAIIDLGPEALPFLFEKLQKGHFYLNEAIAEITRVNLRNDYPDDIGEQKLSEHWLEWWKRHQTDTAS
jgi:hypothetical protein